MKIAVEATGDFFRTDEGFPVRAWVGETERGVKVIALIAAITSPVDQDHSQLEAELREIPGPMTADAAERRAEGGGGLPGWSFHNLDD